MSVTKQDLNIGGLPVNIYSKSDSAGTRPVVAFFLLHGRHGSTEQIDPIARMVVAQALPTDSGRQRDLVVVTFVSLAVHPYPHWRILTRCGFPYQDHRNHGHRLTDPKANEAWGKEPRNDRHAQVFGGTFSNPSSSLVI